MKTQVTNLEKKRAAPPTALTTDGKKNKKGVREPHLDWTVVDHTKIFKWRTVKNGATIEAGGRTNYWCKNHKLGGKWDGIYCWHKPEDCPNLVPRTGGKTGEKDKDKDRSKS